MVAGGGRGHAPFQLLPGEGEHLVHSAAELERAGDLHTFRLHIDLAPQIGVQSGQAEQRGLEDVGRDPRPGLLDGLKGERHGSDLPVLMVVDRIRKRGKGYQRGCHG